MILLPPFTINSVSGLLMFELSYALVLLVGSIYLSQNLYELIFGLVLSAIILFTFTTHISERHFDWLGAMTNLIFFGFLR